MTGLDTNILVDLMVSSSNHHSQVREGMVMVKDSLCTTPTNIGECLRILTHPKVFSSPLRITEACKLLSELLNFYDIQILEEPSDWWESLPNLTEYIPALKGNEIFDARIALCLKAHNIKRIYTRDSDFLKYDFLSAFFWPKKK